MFFTQQDVSAIESQATTFDEPFNMQEDPRNKMDVRLFKQFYKRAVLNRVRSAEAGRPIFDEVDYIRIIVPGSKDILDVEADAQYITRFAKEWEKYQAKQQVAVTGTPLEAWPALGVGMVAELKALNIFTVEQLASVSDGVTGKLQAGQQLKQRAQAFLDAAVADSQNSKLTEQLEQQNSIIASLQAQVNELMVKTSASAKPIEKVK